MLSLLSECIILPHVLQLVTGYALSVFLILVDCYKKCKAWLSVSVKKKMKTTTKTTAATTTKQR